MKSNKACIFLIILTSLFACNSNKKENKLNSKNNDTLQVKSNKVVYEDKRENLKLSIADTIKISNSYFFSNQDSKDIFQLIINPGLVKNSKAELQIITVDNKIIYTQSFDAFYFIREIYEPDTIPSGGQKVYEEYMEKHWKSLTPKQFEAYFKKNVDNFFGVISFIENDDHEEIKSWEEDITDKKFINEILANPEIKLINIPCFDCDEGGKIIGYSLEQNKVISLVEHD
ncbi:hypothetical protein [Flavobacterium pectinovorum]|uniref:Uncharacterized protein n=1 Tax=Flavobacterium pectinovorum TaxID=29533 RepID=A0A502EZF1_9FLAO|nr:hypothetical protein [Flavobacterium pectinovorum]TPG41551.1 hypothetical protein EAH81_08685 [Flavobacterium pectinovorum]